MDMFVHCAIQIEKKISEKKFRFNFYTIFIVKVTMRLLIRLSQLKQVLKSQDVRYPLTIKAGNFTDKELEVFSKLIQSKERG